MKKYEDHPVLTMVTSALAMIVILMVVSHIVATRNQVNTTPTPTPTATQTNTPTETPTDTPTVRPTRISAAPTWTPVPYVKKIIHTPIKSKPDTDTSIVPSGEVIRVLRYNYGRMEQVLRIHETFSYGGDYVPGLYTRHDVDGLTAVNFASRGLLHRSAVVIAKLYDPKYKVWVTQRLQASDWQMQRDATVAQRLEVDGNTAARLHFYADGTTKAVVLSYENG